MRELIQFVFAVCLSSWTGSAATYFVAPTGDDSHPGSAEAPFRTVNRAAKSARAGDTVIVRDGVYGHENSVTGGDVGFGNEDNFSPVKLEHSGTSSAWITFRAENKWGAVLDCEMRCDSYIDLFNASYIEIAGFVITRGVKEGIHSNDSAHHIVIRGNRLGHIANRSTASRYGQDGIYTGPNCHDFLIEGNVFHDIGRNNPSILDHGLYLRGSNYTVVNNIFYNIRRGYAMQLADGLETVLIAHNTFIFDGHNLEWPGHIMLWRTQRNIKISNNIFYSRNLISAAIARYASAVADCTVENNLIAGSDAIFDPGLPGLLGLGSCTTAANRIDSNPIFRDPGNFDFRLAAGSPAINAGKLFLGVLQDFDGHPRALGHAPDIGAFEFVGSPE